MAPDHPLPDGTDMKIGWRAYGGGFHLALEMVFNLPRGKRNQCPLPLPSPLPSPLNTLLLLSLLLLHTSHTNPLPAQENLPLPSSSSHPTQKQGDCAEGGRGGLGVQTFTSGRSHLYTSSSCKVHHFHEESPSLSSIPWSFPQNLPSRGTHPPIEPGREGMGSL